MPEKCCWETCICESCQRRRETAGIALLRERLDTLERWWEIARNLDPPLIDGIEDAESAKEAAEETPHA